MKRTNSDMKILQREDLALAVKLPGEFESGVPEAVAGRDKHHDLPCSAITIELLANPNASANFRHDHATGRNVTTLGMNGEFPQRILSGTHAFDVPAAIDQNRTTHESAPSSLEEPYLERGSATRMSIGSLFSSNSFLNSSGLQPKPSLRTSTKRARRSTSRKAMWIASVFVLAPVKVMTRSSNTSSILNDIFIHTSYIRPLSIATSFARFFRCPPLTS